jgi:ATP-dependent Clp protease ATP-binding subunit ClpA
VIEDPVARQRLATLGERLSHRIVGQRQAAMGTQEAIRSNVTDRNNPRPPFLVYLGPTGTGKTEMAMALAEEETGDPGRIDIVDLGATIKNENDIDAFFGVGRQMQGGLSASEFQRILAKGDGVVLLDEIGNIGGPPSSKAGISPEEARQDAERREKLKQKFLTALYTVTDRGSWTAPNGEVYNLKGKRFVITSNEMQDEVMHMPENDQKIARWEEINNPQYLKAGLQERGWPQALLSRLGNAVYYFKPLVLDEKVELTQAMLNKTLVPLVKSYGLGGLTISPQTVRNIAESFYSHAAGGRSIRDLAGTPVSDLLADAITSLYEKHIDAIPDAAKKNQYKQGVRVELTLDDSYQDLFRFPGRTPPARSVILHLKMHTPDGEEDFSRDLTQIAPAKRLLSEAEVERAAFHQAARLVTNNPSITGLSPRFATVKPAGDEIGFVQFREDKAQAKRMTRAEAVSLIATAMAGLEVRQKMQDSEFSGLAGDMRQARAIAEKAIRQNMLVSSAQALRQMVQGGAAGEAVAEREIETLLEEGTLLAQNTIEKRWSTLQAVAAALTSHPQGAIRGTEIENLLGQGQACEFGDLAGKKPAPVTAGR